MSRQIVPSPETIYAFILGQLDRVGLGHTVFTAEALAWVVRSGEGLLRRTHNLCHGFAPPSGLSMVGQEAGDLLLPTYPGLIVKDSCWRWPEPRFRGEAMATAEARVAAHPTVTRDQSRARALIHSLPKPCSIAPSRRRDTR